MLIIALVLFLMLAVAAFCALRLARTPQTPVKVEASPMRATLERRIRDGADFRI